MCSSGKVCVGLTRIYLSVLMRYWLQSVRIAYNIQSLCHDAALHHGRGSAADRDITGIEVALDTKSSAWNIISFLE